MKRYFSRVMPVLVAMLLAGTAQMVAMAQTTAPSEAELIAVLKSDAPKADKAITCKKLAVFGSAEAVPAIAPLLTDSELTSWARIALEAIPGPEADDALYAALEKTDGRTRIGIINSIGVRNDMVTIGPDSPLVGLLKSDDPETVEAAAVTIGRIGTLDAARRLVIMLEGTDTQRHAAAQGCVILAERLMERELMEPAKMVYNAVRKADVPEIRKIEATRGVILAGGNDELPLLRETLHSEDRQMRNIALAAARELPGESITKLLIAELDAVPADIKPLVVLALADRGDKLALPAIVAAVTDGDHVARMAAIEAMATMGDATCIPALVAAAADADEAISEAAKSTLTTMTGADVNGELVKRLATATGDERRALINLVGTRRIASGVPALLKAADDGDATIRMAAIVALGETVSQEQMAMLVKRFVTPMAGDDAATVKGALRSAAVRMPDQNVCATMLTTAMDGTSVVMQKELLEIIAAVAGDKSLETLGNVALTGDRELQDAATQLLGNWMTTDAGPVLLAAAKDEQNEFRVRALRGYLRLARQFPMDVEQRLEFCREGLATATRDAERKLVLEIAARRPGVEMLQVVVDVAKKYPELKTDASNAAIAIAQKIPADDTINSLLGELGLKAMKIEIVKAVYGAGNRTVDVTTTLRRRVGGFPAITLANPNYNTSFGGDPANGVVKRLRIEYKIDGKAGTAEFAENTAIVLPVPE